MRYPRKPTRKAHQDVGTDPFEDGFDPWEGLDNIAENFTWATAPGTGLRQGLSRPVPGRSR